MSRPLLYVAIGLGLAVIGLGLSGSSLGGDNVASLLYLAIIGLFAGAWVVRMPRENALRNAMIWVLIVLGLVALYAFGGFGLTSG